MPCPHSGGPAGHLETLRQELASRGWITSLLAPEGRLPSLFVQNPDPGAAALNDHVLAAPDRDGSCWFWWPWATSISPAGQVPEAADRVTSVLRATESRGTPAGQAGDRNGA